MGLFCQIHHDDFFPISVDRLHLIKTTSNGSKRSSIVEDKRLELVYVIPLFDEFAALWFSQNDIGWKYSYRVTVGNALDKHLLPVFGERPVSKIKKADILAFRAIDPDGDATDFHEYPFTNVQLL